MADGKAAGQPRRGLNMIVAVVSEANGCMMVTDHATNFAGFINPPPGLSRS